MKESNAFNRGTLKGSDINLIHATYTRDSIVHLNHLEQSRLFKILRMDKPF